METNSQSILCGMTLFGILLLRPGETEAQRARAVCGQQLCGILTLACIDLMTCRALDTGPAVDHWVRWLSSLSGVCMVCKMGQQQSPSCEYTVTQPSTIRVFIHCASEDQGPRGTVPVSSPLSCGCRHRPDASILTLGHVAGVVPTDMARPMAQATEGLGFDTLLPAGPREAQTLLGGRRGLS